MIVIT